MCQDFTLKGSKLTEKYTLTMLLKHHLDETCENDNTNRGSNNRSFKFLIFCTTILFNRYSQTKSNSTSKTSIALKKFKSVFVNLQNISITLWSSQGTQNYSRK